ncbi:hypothetical protein [Alkalihalobacillus trypoxylicola]|uniref:Uncharacterized protein n=1 Tax=Alkalihalobacillus trypoxylicola TaxID=519424 RepID=A0A162DQP0_9BACI|nr:hypothetical protein [Alkalihalobacillus trypoxylicola]KYG30581.1 hypothetical protein AZF04_19230 [Alkalihalobacillus trypoxylicola]
MEGKATELVKTVERGSSIHRKRETYQKNGQKGAAYLPEKSSHQRKRSNRESLFTQKVCESNRRVKREKK